MALIGFLAVFSIGRSSSSKEEIDKILSNMKSFDMNKSNIYLYLKTYCSNVFDVYPELVHLVKYDICINQSFTMALSKVAFVFSTFYNIILPFILYGQPLFRASAKHLRLGGGGV
jgi:hypothetical protein